MPLVASVRLRYASQDYWFDPAGNEINVGDHVLVETSRGEEIGLCTQAVEEVDSSEIKKELKPIVRVATEEDLAKSEELNKRAQDALVIFRELAEKHELDMCPTVVEFSFDETHATFYFTSDDRVDFRALVRDLAAEFHIRIDMRQVGPRDEARIIGGLGHCGEELCCRRLGGEFQPVSIRMAKEQDLPLNPSKISGLCGRLMCCLRYEHEAYKDFKSRAPKKNGLVETPAGVGKVVELDTPRETVTLRMEDGSTLVLPLSSLDTGDKVAREGERIRPCHISQANFDKIIEDLRHDSTLAMMGDKLFSKDPKLADAPVASGAVERVPRRQRSSQESERKARSTSERKPRRRTSEAPEPKPRDERKRRRSVSAVEGAPVRREEAPKAAMQAEEKERATDANRSRRRRKRSTSKPKQQANAMSEAPRSSKPEGRPRPGQHSSTVSGAAPKSSSKQEASSNAAPSNPKRRRRRRGGRGRGAGGGSSAGGEGKE